MIKFNIKIRGKDWEINLQDNKSFNRKYKRTDAVTFPNEKKIIFKPGTVSLKTIRHELFHAYVAESHINSAELDINQFEEIMAELWADSVEDFVAQANEIDFWIQENKFTII